MTDIMGNENLRTLWDGLSRQRGAHTFLAYQDREGARAQFTYREFDGRINRAANLFLQLGVRPQENVALHLHNSPEFLMCLFGLAKIGAVAVPLNIHQTAEECAFVFDRCAVRFVITEQQFLCCYEGEGACPAERIVFVGEGAPSGAVAFDEGCAAQPTMLTEERSIDSSDVCEILFTSGTTSCPKGVELTHANMLFGGLYGDWQLSVTGEDRVLSTMPACHSNFQLSALMPVLTAGATLLFVQKYSARRFWRQVRELRATVIQLVAMMARTLMLQPVDPAERDHSVREVQYYLAISNEEKTAFEDRFGVRLLNSYGLTESVGWVLTDPPRGERRWPSVGRAGIGYEVEVFDDAGHACPPGEVGEIRIKGEPGRTLMKGYHRDPEATARTYDEHGWMRTGDKGYRDESGWFYFIDRKCNMLKRGGENVSASEVEETIMEHPSVKEAAVIGVPDPIWDQAVKAFIVLEDGARLTECELKQYCLGRLAEFKVPSIVVFVPDLPHTSVGKVAKKLLA